MLCFESERVPVADRMDSDILMKISRFLNVVDRMWVPFILSFKNIRPSVLYSNTNRYPSYDLYTFYRKADRKF